MLNIFKGFDVDTTLGSFGAKIISLKNCFAIICIVSTEVIKLALK